MRYFKKLDPKRPVTLPNNSQVTFSTKDDLTGYFQTENPYIIESFLTHIAEQRSGICEIPFDEYKADYLEKKTPSPSNPNWREEYGRGQRRGSSPIERLGPKAVEAAVAVKHSDAVKAPAQQAPPVTAEEGATTAQSEGKKQPYVPPHGRRKRSAT